MRIRQAKPEDAAALLAIYTPYILETAITFEYEVPTEEEFAQRIRRTLERYPYLVAEEDEKICGYAYASAFKERRAYDWAVETSIYVEKTQHGKGIGTQLYEALECQLRRQNILNVNACIAFPHPESISFHERHGYRLVGHFTSCGYKLGKWWDMVWMEKMLTEHPEVPEPVVWYRDLDEQIVT